MMRVVIIRIGWYGARCEAHPLWHYESDNASRIIQHAQRHNARMHPRRFRREYRRFVR